MKNRLIMAVFLICAVVVIPAFAQEAMDADVQKDDMEIFDVIEEDLMVTYGTVVGVSDKQIVILEYDFDLDEDIEVTYIVNEDTLLEEIETLDELLEDDPVEIVYEEKAGGRTALLIKKEDFGLDDIEDFEDFESYEEVGDALDDLEAAQQEEAVEE